MAIPAWPTGFSTSTSFNGAPRDATQLRPARLASYRAWSARSRPAATVSPGCRNATPILTDTYFLTHDGLHLPLRHWDAVRPKAVIVALHGMSDYARAFAMPSSPFNASLTS